MAYYNPYYMQSMYGANPYVLSQQMYQPPMQNAVTQPVYNAQAPQTQPQMPQPGTFNWVKSDRDVDMYYVAPNCVVTLWNENEPVVYMKQADATGKPTVRTFDLVERVQKTATEEKAPDYVTKEELGSFGTILKEMNESVSTLKSDIDTMKADIYGIAGKKKTVRKTEDETNE